MSPAAKTTFQLVFQFSHTLFHVSSTTLVRSIRLAAANPTMFGGSGLKLSVEEMFLQIHVIGADVMHVTVTALVRGC
jgi:hypothetical protein